jgi:hypothetical protein
MRMTTIYLIYHFFPISPIYWLPEAGLLTVGLASVWRYAGNNG